MDVALRCADRIPVAHTPPGGYGTDDEMPPPVLAGDCPHDLPEGVPDLRGTWRVTRVRPAGATADAEDHPLLGVEQRIEQCGDRLVVTAGGVIHDMRCDGTVEHGVHDVMQADFTTPIAVVATYEDGVHVLRPQGLPVEVRRHRDGEQLVWDYVGFTARLERVERVERVERIGDHA
jgi:hypothetical protein